MPPTIVAESLPDGMEGEAYSSRLTAKGTAPITWSIVSGVLPEGLSLNEDTGEISGTPAGEGTEVFTVMAVNALGEDIKEFSITIAKSRDGIRRHRQGRRSRHGQRGSRLGDGRNGNHPDRCAKRGLPF